MLIPYYYKSPNILTNQGTHNWPLSSSLELREVLTWPSEGIWPAPHQCFLLGPFFLCCAGVVRSRVCRVPHWWFSKHHHNIVFWTHNWISADACKILTLYKPLYIKKCKDSPYVTECCTHCVCMYTHRVQTTENRDCKFSVLCMQCVYGHTV